MSEQDTQTCDKLTGEMFKSMLHSASAELEAHKEEVNSLNVFPVPDGDTGTNMMLTLESAVQQGTDSGPELYDIADDCSTGSLMGARGNSGVILSQFFRGVASSWEGVSEANSQQIAHALQSGVDAAYSAVMRPVEGTILTVAKEAAAAASQCASEDNDVLTVLQDALKAAEVTLKKTPEMLDVLAEAGVVDAGGQGLVYILRGAVSALKQKPVQEKTPLEQDQQIEQEQVAVPDDEVLTYPYDVIVLVDCSSSNIDVDEIRGEMVESGDSLLVIKDGDMVKIHIHTQKPDLVVKRSLNWGTVVECQIENMQLQVSRSQEAMHNLEATATDKPGASVPPTPQDNPMGGNDAVAVVPIVAGEGLAEQFLSRGAQCTVFGGPTMNPSAEDILSEVDDNCSGDVILLPNNPNLILVCEQVKSLTDRRIEVVPTENVPQGLAAIAAFDPNTELNKVRWRMEEAASEVVALEVTYAVDDRDFGGISLDKGDVIGFIDGEFVSVGEKPCQVLLELVEHEKSSDWHALSVFVGNCSESYEEKSDSYLEFIEEKLLSALGNERTIKVSTGGQQHYYFIAAALRG